METMVTISLERYRQLESIEKAVNEKKVVLIRSIYIDLWNYNKQDCILLNAEEAMQKIAERIEELNNENNLLKDKLKKKWF